MTSRNSRTDRQSMVSPRRPAADSRGFRVSPGPVFVVLAVILSVGFGLYALTVRDTSQIPLLAAGAVVVGIAFAGLALYSLSAVWRAGIEGRGGRAIVLGLLGGVAAMIAAGCLAGAVVLFLLAGSS